MRHIRISDRLVERLRPGETLWDDLVRGFGVRMQSSRRSFIVKATINGKQRFVTIGAHNAPWTTSRARNEARRILVHLTDQGTHSPVESSITVAELCARYETEHARRFNKQSSVINYVGIIRNHIVPLMGERKICDLGRSDILLFQKKVREGATAPADKQAWRIKYRGGKSVSGGPGVANRSVSLLSKIFNLAEDWGLKPPNSNPTHRIRRFPERPCERFLSQEEFVRLGRALKAGIDNERERNAASLIMLLALTGARLGELRLLKWSYVNLQSRMLLLPDSKTGRRTIHLSAEALFVFAQINNTDGNPFVFAGRSIGAPIVNISKYWNRIKQNAGLVGVRLHDLRHTYASYAVNAGHSLPVIGALLGHTSTKTTQRYAHLAETSISVAATQIGSELGALLPIEGPPKTNNYLERLDFLQEMMHNSKTI